MASFQDLRNLLEGQFDRFVQEVDEPDKFRQEFGNLQGYWDSDDTEEGKIEETLDVMGRYPPVRVALQSIGVVLAEPEPAVPAPQAEASPPVVPQEPAIWVPEPGAGSPAAAPEPGIPPPSPAGRSKRPRGENRMAESPPKGSVLERLAVLDKWTAVLKEGITGLLGVMIVGVTLAIAIAALYWVQDEEASARVKDVLLLMNGLAGVVLGYYFGRMPGEARADKAESETKATRNRLHKTVADVRSVLAPEGMALERGMAGMELSRDQMDRLRDILEHAEEE